MTLKYNGTFIPDDALQICMADINHQVKYMGVGGRGKSRYLASSEIVMTTEIITPVEAVQRGLEPIAYLDTFGRDSAWHIENQLYKGSLTEQATSMHDDIQELPYL